MYEISNRCSCTSKLTLHVLHLPTNCTYQQTAHVAVPVVFILYRTIVNKSKFLLYNYDMTSMKLPKCVTSFLISLD